MDEKPSHKAPEESAAAPAAEMSVTYHATWPGGITASTTVTAQWAQDWADFPAGMPVLGGKGCLYEKRAPSVHELNLLRQITRNEVAHN